MHVQPIHLRHDNVGDDQIRRPLTAQIKPLTAVGSFRDLILRLFKSGSEKYTNDFFVSDDRIVAITNTFLLLSMKSDFLSLIRVLPPRKARGSNISGDGNEEILSAKQNVTPADSPPKSLSDIDFSTVANNPRPSASFSVKLRRALLAIHAPLFRAVHSGEGESNREW